MNGVNVLHPCPFCGSSDQFVGTSESISGDETSSGYYAVCCSYTGCGCGATSGYRPTIAEAVDAWNLRAMAIRSTT